MGIELAKHLIANNDYEGGSGTVRWTKPLRLSTPAPPHTPTLPRPLPALTW